MSTDPINSLSKILSVVRQQISAKEKKTGQPATNLISKATKHAHSDVSIEQTKAQIIRRIKSIDADDPRRNNKAIRIFLESVLINEFGDSLLNDPSFQQMINDIQKVIETNPKTLAEFTAFVSQ